MRLYQGYSSSGRYMNGWRQSKAVTSPHTTKLWAKYPDMIVQAAARLKEAQIECRPALDVIEAHNSSDAFLYVDPPYYPEVRKPCIYTHEMRKEDHEELLDVLLKHKGRVLLSGYDNPLYDDALKNWKKYRKDTTADSGMRRTEVLWANYEGPDQLTLDLKKRGESLNDGYSENPAGLYQDTGNCVPAHMRAGRMHEHGEVEKAL